MTLLLNSYYYKIDYNDGEFLILAIVRRITEKSANI